MGVAVLSRVAGLLGLTAGLTELPVQPQLPRRGRKLRYSPGIPAPSSGSRQNERRLDIFHAMRVIVSDYPGEPRSVRRRMARELGKRTWRKRFGLPDPEYAHA